MIPNAATGPAGAGAPVETTRFTAPPAATLGRRPASCDVLPFATVWTFAVVTVPIVSPAW